MFQKYPMSLYLRGDALADHVIVTSEEEEAAKRAEGFKGAWEPQEKEPDADHAESDGAGHTVESVRAQLDALGIAYDKRLGLAKLLALLPA